MKGNYSYHSLMGYGLIFCLIQLIACGLNFCFAHDYAILSKFWILKIKPTEISRCTV